MTVADNYEPVEYVGNGVTTQFPFSWQIGSAEELVLISRVAATGVDTVVPAVNYSVVVADYPGTGYVEYEPSGSPLAATHSVILTRTSDFTQDMDIRNQSGFLPAVLEDQLDAIERQVQELREQLDRTIKPRVKTATTVFELPEPADGEVLGWDGTEVVNKTPANLGVDVVGGDAGLAIVGKEDEDDVRLYLGVAPFLTTRSALSGLDQTKDLSAFVNGNGGFGFDGTDLSSILIPNEFTTTAVDIGTDTFSLKSGTTTAVNDSPNTFTFASNPFISNEAITITSSDWNLGSGLTYFANRLSSVTLGLRLRPNGGRVGITAVGWTASATVTFKQIHRLRTGDVFYVSASTADLTAGVPYYAIVPDIYTFKAATSRANAFAGTAVNLTAATNITVRAHADATAVRFVEGAVGEYDGTLGMFVSEHYRTGKEFALAEFGTIAGVDDSAIMKDAVNACNVYYHLTGAVPTLRLPEGKTVALNNIFLGANIRILQHGCRIVVPFNDAAHATRPGTTERLYEAVTEAGVQHIIIEGGAIYGSYDSAISVVTPLSLMYFESVVHVKVHQVAFRECATGTTGLPALAYDRDHGLVTMLNCRRSSITECDVRGGAGGMEEFNIYDNNGFGDKRVWIAVNDNKFRDGTTSNSAINVITCLGGTVCGNTVLDYQNSAFNVMSDGLYISTNYINKVASSYAIDLGETGYYWPSNCVVINNVLKNINSSGIFAGGHNNFIVGNDIDGADIGIRCTNSLTTQANIEALLGVGMVPVAEEPKSGSHISYNKIRNCVEASIKVVGESSTNVISLNLEGNVLIYGGTTMPLSAIHLENVGSVTIRGGELNDGSSNLVRIAGTNAVVELDGVRMRYSASASIGHGVQMSGTSVNRLSLRNCRFLDAPNAGKSDIINSAGTIKVVTFDGTTGADATSGLSTTPILYNGIAKATASLDFASVPANSAGTPLTVTVYGARSGDPVTVNTSSSSLAYTYLVSADNTVEITPHNYTTGAFDRAAANFHVGVAVNLNALMAA